MRRYPEFLRAHPAWWIVPIVGYVGALLWLASAVASTPANPFAYSAY